MILYSIAKYSSLWSEIFVKALKSSTYCIFLFGLIPLISRVSGLPELNDYKAGIPEALSQIPPMSTELIFDKDLQLSNPKFIEIIRMTTGGDARRRLVDVAAFPSTLTFAQFSSVVYENYHPYENDKSYGERLNLPLDWMLLTTASNGYFGAAFWNPLSRQIVVAHRGTQFSSWESLKADVLGVVGNQFEKSLSSACSFVYLIRTALQKANVDDVQIFLTGHSLGGWLAQVTAFCIEYLTVVPSGNGGPNYFLKSKRVEDENHLHTEVFESPGAFDILWKMAVEFDVRYHGKSTKIDNLDISSYLSSPNKVNCFNTHVGKVYRVFTNVRTDLPIKYTLESHSIDRIVEALRRRTVLKEVIDWPTLSSVFSVFFKNELEEFFKWASSSNQYNPDNILRVLNLTIDARYYTIRYQTKEHDANQLSVNVFTEREAKFVRNYGRLLKDKSFEIDSLFNEISDVNYRKYITDKLKLLKISNETVTTREGDDVRQVVPFVKTLLRVHPEVEYKIESALLEKDLEQRYMSTYKNQGKLSHRKCPQVSDIVRSFVDAMRKLPPVTAEEKIIWKTVSVPETPSLAVIVLINIITVMLLHGATLFTNRQKRPNSFPGRVKDNYSSSAHPSVREPSNISQSNYYITKLITQSTTGDAVRIYNN